MDDIFDAVIIGGGIAGSTTGKLISEHGHKVLIIEEHREIGKPLQCAGLVTPRIFKIVPENGCTLNEVSGAIIHSPNGKQLKIDAGKTKALVIDRVRLDQNCMSAAGRAGCYIRLGAKAISAKHTGKSVTIKIFQNGKTYSITSKMIIGADGVQSQVSRWFNLKGPKAILPGFGAELAGVDSDPRFVEIFIGNDIAPNFFAWVIPKARKKIRGVLPARVGLACSKASKFALQYYHKLFSHPYLGPRLAKSRPIQYIAGAIPLGLVAKSYTDNVMLVGDAAGQVKPTSGGGVYTSIICAGLCAKTADQALMTKDYSAKILRSYQHAWQTELGKELKQGYRLFKVFMHLTDDQLEEGFKLLGEKAILNIISSEGDIDYPSKVTTKVIKRVPQLLKFAKPYLRSFF
jgi:geranylgeranyl reductase family protein